MMAFFLVRIFLLVITSQLNEVFPKLNLPFLKGYSPNKMNRKMPLVHINVILPSSKSVLITTFQEAAQLNRRELNYSVHQDNYQRGSQTVSFRGAFLWRDALCSANDLSFPFFQLECHLPPAKRGEENTACQLKAHGANALYGRFSQEFLKARLFKISFPFCVQKWKKAPRGVQSTFKVTTSPDREEVTLAPNSKGFDLGKRHKLYFPLSCTSLFKRNSVGG